MSLVPCPRSPVRDRVAERYYALYSAQCDDSPLVRQGPRDMPTPLPIVIFGASGDLTARKLIPSLYRLDRKKRLPSEARIVGVARSPFGDDAYRAKLRDALRQFLPKEY